jgi:hypothetical protein
VVGLALVNKYRTRQKSLYRRDIVTTKFQLLQAVPRKSTKGAQYPTAEARRLFMYIFVITVQQSRNSIILSHSLATICLKQWALNGLFRTQNIYSLRTHKSSRLGQRHGLQSATLTSYFYQNMY